MDHSVRILEAEDAKKNVNSGGLTCEVSEVNKGSNGIWAGGRSCRTLAKSQMHSAYVLRTWVRLNSGTIA